MRIVLGRPLTAVAGLDLALEGVVFEQDGQIVATQTAAEVLGNPLVSLAWAANALGKMGRGLRAGDIVLTGSISKVLRPTAGQSVRASFTRLGVCGLSLRVSRLATGSFASMSAGAGHRGLERCRADWRSAAGHFLPGLQARACPRPAGSRNPPAAS